MKNFLKGLVELDERDLDAREYNKKKKQIELETEKNTGKKMVSFAEELMNHEKNKPWKKALTSSKKYPFIFTRSTFLL